MSFRPIDAGELPVFRKDLERKAVYYTPGFMAGVERSRAQEFENHLTETGGSAVKQALLSRARQALETHRRTATRPFAPVCLTMYLHHNCNLHCSYCYSESKDAASPAERLSEDAVRAAAPLVLDQCEARHLPFTVVFHGGGEPALKRTQADAMLDLLERLAEERGIPIFRYIATNGMLSIQKAEWLAHRFDLIGISCDGPADIQNRQRPKRSGGASAGTVERTARILHDNGKPFNVRATITPRSAGRQAEIAHYLCEVLRPREIHAEAVYLGGRASAPDTFQDESVETFVAEFFRARETARRHGVPWTTSGTRLSDVHGPYCNIFRDVLNLVPDGTATACFKQDYGPRIREKGLCIGGTDRASGRFTIDTVRVRELQAALSGIPGACGSCFNQYHCTRQCPDRCPLDPPSPQSSFRCRVQKLIAETELMETGRILDACEEAEAGMPVGA